MENIWEALKLIGIKQEDEFYFITEIDSTGKIQMPSWVDSIEKVLWFSPDITVEEIEADLNNYSKNAYIVPRSEKLIMERNIESFQYLIRNGWLYTNAGEGSFLVIYRAIPVDENGEPLIPEEVHLVDAIVWFNVKEFLWELTVRNQGQYGALFEKAEREWGYYAIQAKTASIFPKNDDSRRYLEYSFLKLLPDFKK